MSPTHFPEVWMSFHGVRLPDAMSMLLLLYINSKKNKTSILLLWIIC